MNEVVPLKELRRSGLGGIIVTVPNVTVPNVTVPNGNGPVTEEAGEPGLPVIGLYYDFRNPAAWEHPLSDVYRSILDQAVWAEQELGFGSVWISEHHLVEDGYTPSPMTLAAALAVRTERMRIGTSVVILPLQHPVRLAEDALTVHALSRGRFTLGVGLGYRPSEYAGLGIPMGERRGRLEEGLKILRAAFAGEELDHRGAHFDLGRIRVTPAPSPSAGPELFIGGFAPPAIRRAAAVADGMVLPIPDLWPVYAEECARIGRRPRVVAGHHWIISEDPEAELRRVAPHVIHQVNEYGASGAYGPADSWEPITGVEGLVRFGLYELLDAEAAARRIVDFASHGFVEDVHWWTVFPGEPIERSSARLAYVADRVMPLARQLLATRHEPPQLGREVARPD